MEGYVLIADDDPDARQILGVIVRSLEVTYKTVINGSEALECIKDEMPQIVLLDLLMPEMDGFAVLSRLQSDPKTRYIPVIVVTACTLDQVDILKLPGVKEVIQKGNLVRLKTLIADALHLEIPSQPITGSKPNNTLIRKSIGDCNTSSS